MNRTNLSKVLFSAFVLVAAAALTGCNNNEAEEEAEVPATEQQDTGDASSTPDDAAPSTGDTAPSTDNASATADSGEATKCPLCVIYEVATEGQPDQSEFFACSDSPPEPPSMAWFEENCATQEGDNQYFRSFAVGVVLPAN